MRRQIHLNYKNIGVYLVCFILIPLNVLKSGTFLWKTSYLIMSCCCVVYSLYLCVNRIASGRLKIRKDFLCFLLMFIWLFVCDAYHRTFNNELVFAVSRMTIIYLLLLSRKRYVLIKGLSRITYLIVVINLCTQFLFPKGIIDASAVSWQKYYILQNCNAFSFFYMFALSMSLINSVIEKGKIGVSCYFLYLLEMVSYFCEGEDTSTSGIISISILFIGCLVYSNGLIKKLSMFIGRHVRVMLLCSAILIFVLATNEQIKNNIFIPAILAITGEDFSFDARTMIWSSSINSVLLHPIFGTGTLDSRSIYSVLDGKYTSSHNNMLQLANIGGVPALFFWVMGVVYAISKQGKGKKQSGETYIAIIGEIAYIILFMVEQQPIGVLFYYLVLIGTTVSDMKGFKYNEVESNVKR